MVASGFFASLVKRGVPFPASVVELLGGVGPCNILKVTNMLGRASSEGDLLDWVSFECSIADEIA